MRLLKLLFLTVIGYVVYEYIIGQERQRQATRSGDLERALNRDPGRMNVTGPARGEDEVTEEISGAQSHHTVGRGVVR